MIWDFNIYNRPDRGQLLENYIFIRLMEMHREEEIKFWRTGDQKEVDFVVTPAMGNSFALEVKFGSANLKTTKYNKFINTYPGIALKFISYMTENESDFIPAIKL